MRKSTLGLLLALLTITLFNATTASATVVRYGNLIRCSATADTFSTSSGEPVITQIEMIPSATGKYYQFRDGSASGTVIWKHVTAGTVKETDTAPIQLPNSHTIYVESDDTTITGLFIWTRPTVMNPR